MPCATRANPGNSQNEEQQANADGQDVPPPPPPPTMEQMMRMQTQILQQLATNFAQQQQ